MATLRPEQRLRKKKKPPKRFRLTYSLLLLFTMVVVGLVAGLVAYRFGKQALEGVNPTPAGIKSPKVLPSTKPKDPPKSSSQGQTDDKISFLLDEAELIAEIKARSQQELGAMTRPAFVAKSNVSERKSIYTRVDRAYNSMRDPLAISANADERISARIAALRQRVYTRSRSYESNIDRLSDNNSSTSIPLLSTPIELTPIRSRWQDRDAVLSNPSKVTVEDNDTSTKPSNTFSVPQQQIPKPLDVNRQ